MLKQTQKWTGLPTPPVISGLSLEIRRAIFPDDVVILEQRHRFSGISGSGCLRLKNEQPESASRFRHEFPIVNDSDSSND